MNSMILFDSSSLFVIHLTQNISDPEGRGSPLAKLVGFHNSLIGFPSNQCGYIFYNKCIILLKKQTKSMISFSFRQDILQHPTHRTNPFNTIYRVESLMSVLLRSILSTTRSANDPKSKYYNY